MTPSGFWRTLWEKLLRSPYLLLLFVASVLLSIASFWTTYIGITPFVGVAVFAFFITAAIQSLLFVVSWRLGFMFAGKEGVAKVDLLVFLVTFTLSVFFSFNALFNVIFAEELRTEASLTRVRDGALGAVNQAEAKLVRQAADQAAALRESPDYARWRADVLDVADLAQRAGPAMRDLLDTQREQQRSEATRLTREARELAARKGTIEDEIEQRRVRLDRLREQREPERTALDALTGEERTLETEVVQRLAARDAEEGGIGETGRAGRGPVWAALDTEYRRAEADLLALRQQAEIRRQRLAELDAEIRDAGEQLRRDEALFADLDGEIAAAERRATEARARLTTLGEEVGMEAGVQQLRDFPTRFEETGDPGHLAQAEQLCTQLHDNLRTVPAVAGELDGLSCDRGPIAPLVQALTETRALRAALQRQCTSPDAPSFYEMAPEQALAAARACLDLSRLPFAQLRGERGELDRLQREEGPHASEFTRTTNALFAGEKLAVFSLVLALSMDLLVLFTGLIGAKSARTTFAIRVLEPRHDDDPRVFAIKALLRHLAPFTARIDGVLYQGQIDLDRIHNPRERDLIGQLLKRNSASGMTRPVADDESAFLLRYGALEQLEEQLDRHTRGRAAAPVAPPPPGPTPGRHVPQVEPPRPVGLGGRLGNAVPPPPRRHRDQPAANAEQGTVASATAGWGGATAGTNSRGTDADFADSVGGAADWNLADREMPWAVGAAAVPDAWQDWTDPPAKPAPTRPDPAADADALGGARWGSGVNPADPGPADPEWAASHHGTSGHPVADDDRAREAAAADRDDIYDLFYHAEPGRKPPGSD
ncbi:MAG: hypothetical protein EA400_15795 [Chromatiaceae bacterium]|nr:MAG: hypothetical protein EA400_15795 [Chromatiaceae bacterium]